MFSNIREYILFTIDNYYVLRSIVLHRTHIHPYTHTHIHILGCMWAVEAILASEYNFVRAPDKHCQ